MKCSEQLELYSKRIREIKVDRTKEKDGGLTCHEIEERIYVIESVMGWLKHALNHIENLYDKKKIELSLKYPDLELQ